MSENLNNEQNVSKKEVKKVKKNDEMEQMKQMILNLAQTVGTLSEQLKQAQQDKPVHTPVDPEEPITTEDVPEIHVEGLAVAMRPKGTGKRYAKAGSYTYQVVRPLGDDDDFPLQAKKCMLLLFKACEATEGKQISEATAMAVLRKHQQWISERQDAWKVFAFYRAKLQEADLVIRREKYGVASA